jgi:hypothetical protein
MLRGERGKAVNTAMAILTGSARGGFRLQTILREIDRMSKKCGLKSGPARYKADLRLRAPDRRIERSFRVLIQRRNIST